MQFFFLHCLCETSNATYNLVIAEYCLMARESCSLKGALRSRVDRLS